jgi:hypothetical protein
MRIDQVDREYMLRSAHRMTARKHKQGIQLWVWVRDVCCVGSTSALLICHEYGWDATQHAMKALPPRIDVKQS